MYIHKSALTLNQCFQLETIEHTFHVQLNSITSTRMENNEIFLQTIQTTLNATLSVSRFIGKLFFLVALFGFSLMFTFKQVACFESLHQLNRSRLMVSLALYFFSQTNSTHNNCFSFYFGFHKICLSCSRRVLILSIGIEGRKYRKENLSICIKTMPG